MTALLQEAQSDNATLASDLGYAHRECTELASKLSLQIYYVQRVKLSANITFTAQHPPGCLTCLTANLNVCVCFHSKHTCEFLLICHGKVVWQVGRCS